MSVLVYTETLNGKFKKNAFEVASYAASLAKEIGTEVVAMAINAESCEELHNYGVKKVLHLQSEALGSFNAKAYAHAVAKAAEQENASVVVVSSTTDSKFMASIMAARLQAGYVPNVVAAPLSTSPLVVKRMTFSNKGFAHTQIDTDLAIIGVSNNSFGLVEDNVAGEVVPFSADIDDSAFDTSSKNIERVTGKVTIADADIVVSGGRGLKGPQGWRSGGCESRSRCTRRGHSLFKAGFRYGMATSQRTRGSDRQTRCQ